MKLFNDQVKLKIFFLSIIFVFIIIFIIILLKKNFELASNEKARQEEIAKGAIVKTAKITLSPPQHEVKYNGETRPNQSVTLYAKVSGYLKKILVDKGDVVKEGQILAVIESPVTDEAYLAALANFKNKKAIAKRTVQLHKENLVSKQDTEQAVSDAEIAESQYNAQKVLKGYETIRAPFSGTITARYADVGALVQNAENSQSSALPIVTISEIKRLRVDVYIDQNDVNYIRINDPVQIQVQGMNNKQIFGRINRYANQLDAKTKMMIAEIDIDNKNREIIAGSFVKVFINIKIPSYFCIPVEALILIKDKPFIAIISPDNKIYYRPIQIENNDGKIILFQGEVKIGDKVALNIGSDFVEGSTVRPITDKK